MADSLAWADDESSDSEPEENSVSAQPGHKAQLQGTREELLVSEHDITLDANFMTSSKSMSEAAGGSGEGIVGADIALKRSLPDVLASWFQPWKMGLLFERYHALLLRQSQNDSVEDVNRASGAAAKFCGAD